MHPALYYKGLLDAARRYGVRLASRTNVERITGKRGAFRLRTSRGEMTAEQVIVATNGYTGDATPQLKRKLIPVASHIIATEELPEGLAKSLIPKGRTISDTPRVLCYYRLSPDGKRMLFGGRARFTAVTPEVSAPVLHRFMTDRFPQLKDAKVTHAWTGNVAFTFDFLPHMGQVQDGMHFCLGCNGSGVAMMTYLGHRTAQKIIGGGDRVGPFEELELPGQVGYGGTPIRCDRRFEYSSIHPVSFARHTHQKEPPHEQAAHRLDYPRHHCRRPGRIARGAEVLEGRDGLHQPRPRGRREDVWRQVHLGVGRQAEAPRGGREGGHQPVRHVRQRPAGGDRHLPRG